MGDVADLLGVERAEAPDPLALALGGKTKKGERKAAKPVGMSREVYALLGEQGLPPSMPTKKPSAKGGGGVRWEWVEFANSARADNVTFFHWVKASAQHPDYAYAKYNVKTEAVTYSDGEYERLLRASDWTRAETDQLMRLCARHDLCWPVIADRFEARAARPVESLQERFYDVVAKLRAARAGGGKGAKGGSGSGGAIGGLLAAPGADAFDREYERKRRHQLDLQFRKTHAMEREEESLREELKGLEAQIKKLKAKRKAEDNDKLAAEAAGLRDAGRVLSTAAADRGNGRHPPGRPYLQSHRAAAAFQTPAHQLGKTLMKKVQMVLAELQVPELVMATQIVCDLQDALKKDVVTLLTLQKVVAKKESDLQLLKQQQQGGGGGGAAMDVRSTSPGLGLQLAPA
ncbi:hypothetical protein JKP88DRAFT_271069, partial [Tribonema minus]